MGPVYGPSSGEVGDSTTVLLDDFLLRLRLEECPLQDRFGSSL